MSSESSFPYNESVCFIMAVLRTCMTFSLVGTPVIYAGTEVGCHMTTPPDFPDSNYLYEYFSIPMPWDSTSVGISMSKKGDYVYRYFGEAKINDTVEVGFEVHKIPTCDAFCRVL